MAKVIKIEGCQTAIRVDRISAVDRIKEEIDKWVVMIFFLGASDGYRFVFGDNEEVSETFYNNIVKAMEED